MTDTVEFEVAYSEHEFVRGMMHARNRTEFSWFNASLSALPMLLGFGFVYWYAIREPGSFRVNDAIVALVGVVISLPLSVALDRFKPFVESSFGRTFRNNPIYQEKFRVRIDRTGIESRSDSFESLVKWDAFSEAFESDDDFYFLLSESQPLFFPKRAFSPEQILAIRRIAQSVLGSRACFLN